MYMYIHVRICIYAYMYTCMCMYIYLYIHTYTLHIYTHLPEHGGGGIEPLVVHAHASIPPAQHLSLDVSPARELEVVPAG